MTVGLTPHFPLRPGLVSSLHLDCTFFATLTCNLFATTVQILSLTATICACMLTALNQSNPPLYAACMLTAPTLTRLPHLIYDACMLTALLVTCIMSCLFDFTPPPYVPAYSRPATNTHTHSQYSTRPEPCSLPWTCYLLYYLLFTTRPMLPSEDMSSASPPFPHDQRHAPFRGHAVCSPTASPRPEPYFPPMTL